MSEDFYLRTRCRMCDGSDLVKVLSLTPTPPGNSFLKKGETDLSEPCYPLDLYFCNGCHHVQLGHVVDPKILYQTDYTYVSGTSAHFVKHLEVYAEDMVRRFELNWMHSPRGQNFWCRALCGKSCSAGSEKKPLSGGYEVCFARSRTLPALSTTTSERRNSPTRASALGYRDRGQTSWSARLR